MPKASCILGYIEKCIEILVCDSTVSPQERLKVFAKRPLQSNGPVKFICHTLIALPEQVESKLVLGREEIKNYRIRVTRFLGDLADGRVQGSVADEQREGRFEYLSF